MIIIIMIKMVLVPEVGNDNMDKSYVDVDEPGDDDEEEDGDVAPEDEADDCSNNGEAKPSSTEQGDTLEGLVCFFVDFVCSFVCLLLGIPSKILSD